MEVKQIYALMNSVTGEILGKTDVVAEDLSNVVDVGTEIMNASSYDHYVKSMVNHIGRVIFVNRAYQGSAPSVLMDGWAYGSILEKISSEMPEATENESWELTDGQSYDPNIFYQPKASAKFFNKRVTFEIDRSFTERQVKESFSNATQLNAFLSMLYNEVEKSLTVKIDSLIMRTINNMSALALKQDYPTAAYTESSGVRAVNLLHLYKAANPTATTTAENFLFDLDFLKFASRQIALYVKRMQVMSTIFNGGSKERFTPADMMHIVLLADFAASCDSYLQADTFHNELVKLPNHETVPYWQGPGQDYSFGSVSEINVKSTSGDDIHVSGIIGVIFDRDALGVCNLDRRVTTHYNAKAEFYSNFYKFDAGYFNDDNENFVLFFVQ